VIPAIDAGMGWKQRIDGDDRLVFSGIVRRFSCGHISMSNVVSPRGSNSSENGCRELALVSDLYYAMTVQGG
jgi:hypothetical protein